MELVELLLEHDLLLLLHALEDTGVDVLDLTRQGLVDPDFATGNRLDTVADAAVDLCVAVLGAVERLDKLVHVAEVAHELDQAAGVYLGLASRVLV